MNTDEALPSVEKRIVRILISPAILLELMKHGEHHVEVFKSAIPADATFDHFAFDEISGGSLWMFITSESFAVVPYGNVVPVLAAPVFRKVESISLDALREFILGDPLKVELKRP